MSELKQPPTSALSEVLKHWTKSCLDGGEIEEEELQNDSRTFFRYLSRSTHVVTDMNVTLETQSSHEEALAKLIQDLGQAFSAEHHQSRVRALHVLVGAIEGCKETQLSNTITQLLGKFLLSHCGPIEDDEYGEDYDSMIRNAAILGLTALTKIPCSGESDQEILEAFRLRLEFSQQGIKFRCALPENLKDPEDNFSYGFSSGPSDIREGLSTLPRSKRSLCFGLLGAAVKGVAAITNQMKEQLEKSLFSNLQKQLIEFARFASSCLHGESDPRCLLEVLTLLHEMQVACEPHFVTSTSHHDLVFPNEDIFDAVAPYYPIQFTPPPNNIHGITREGLHSALVSVMSYTKLDASALAHNRPSMLSLSAGLFIEQLLPMEEEENTSASDKSEAIECLSNLIFPSEGKVLCDKLDAPTLRNLWSAIKRTHDESSLGISQGGDQGKNNKYLADQCRTLVSKLAFQLELSSNKALWEAFVSEPLQKQVRKLKMSPNQSKLLIAYMACLTASGGPRTLRFCLQVGLESLLDYLGEDLDDSEDAAAAAHGIGAFLSSCQVAIEAAGKEGIVLHPHPLEKYSKRACTVLLDAFNSESVSLSIKIGATRALEFLLLTATEQHLEANQLEALCSYIRKTLAVLRETDETIADWQNTCCLTLGNIVGNVLGSSTDKPELTALSSQAICDMVKKEIYPTLLDLATSLSVSQDVQNFGRKALANVCSSSDVASEEIVSSLLQSLCDSLGENAPNHSCLVYAKSLSYIFHNAGDFPIKAYHDNQLSSTILAVLSRIRPEGEAAVRESVANLTLPNTAEEKKAVYNEIDSVVANLLPAYKKTVPRQRLLHLTKEVSDIIPPLSDTDSINLFVRLPILGLALASLQNNDDSAMETEETSLHDYCISMLPGLTEYVLSNENDSRARSGAASCIFAILSFGTLDMSECPVLPLVKDTVNPYITLAHDENSVRNSLSLMALMGSAAARRGKSSSNTADKIAKFLLELSCSEISTLPFASEETQKIDLSSFVVSNASLSLDIAAASAYGSILSIDMKPLMKQRLTHGCLKYIRAAYEEERDQAQSGQKIAAPKSGLLAMICHVICDIDLSKLDQMTLHQIASITVEGLSSSQLFDPNGAYSPAKTASKNLVLVAILKLLSVAPESVPATGFLLTLVTGLLQAYAVSDPSTEVSSKLLALQGLEAMSRVDGAKKAIMTIQPAVVSVLAAAVNHPSGLLRQAAVDVRNEWYLVE